MIILKEAISALESAGINTAKLDAELLLAAVLGVERMELRKMDPGLRRDEEFSIIQKAQFAGLLKRRLNREPLAYILGKKEFWSLDFKVSPAVLCPRPDTEILVEAALKTKPQSILDLGTGSGAIVLSLLSELPKATGVGVDISPQALEIAKENARNLGLASRVNFLLGSWAEGLSNQEFDLIVSNPPYIESSVISGLEPEVAVFEPKTALDGGSDGLDAYRQIVPQLHVHLKAGGWAILEVGQGQAPAVQQLMSEHRLTNISIAKDYQGIDRCVIAQRS